MISSAGFQANVPNTRGEDEFSIVPEVSQDSVRPPGARVSLSRPTACPTDFHKQGWPLTPSRDCGRALVVVYSATVDECGRPAALGLMVLLLIFVRPHMSLNEKGGPRRTSAMAAGLTDHVWSYKELIERVMPRGGCDCFLIVKKP